LQQLPGDIAARSYAQQEQQYEHKVEFEEQFQLIPPYLS